MSWDVFISKKAGFPDSYKELESLGLKEVIIAKIKTIIPSVDFSDSEWGIYKDNACSIEFSLNDSDKLDYMMLHVRGSGDRPICIIKEICQALKCFATDGSTGEQIKFENLKNDSFLEWQNYKNNIISNL